MPAIAASVHRTLAAHAAAHAAAKTATSAAAAVLTRMPGVTVALFLSLHTF